MRKRTIKTVADTIFWYALYFLPVLAYLFFIFSNPLPEDVEIPVAITDESYEERTVYTFPADTLFYNSSSIGSSFSYMPCILSIPGDHVDYPNSTITFRVPVFVCMDSFYDSLSSSSSSNLSNVIVLRKSGSAYYLAQSFVLVLPKECTFVRYSLSLYPFERTADATSLPSSSSIGYFNQNSASIDTFYQSTELTEVVQTFSYDFGDFVNELGFEFATDNIIVNSLEDIFGASGVLPIFADSAVFIIFAWFVGVYLIHLAVDFLLFIPRYCHKLMNDYTEGL